MKIKKLICNVLLLVTLLNLFGCDPVYYYKGDRYDLLTVAINSVVGTGGYTWNGDAPTINVVEEDSYGRILFHYYERDAWTPHSLVICQKSKHGYVYYYPDYNFICNEDGEFDESEITSLKANNDWDKELYEDKMIYKKIITEKEDSPIAFSEFSSVVEKLLGEEINHITYEYCTSDYFGRTMFVTNVKRQTTNSEKLREWETYIIILSYDFSYNEKSIMKVEDLYNYQQALKEFKDLNRWNQP